MKLPKNLNYFLVLIIILLLTAYLAFDYGYNLGERKGYVMGVKKCVEEIEASRESLSLSKLPSH